MKYRRSSNYVIKARSCSRNENYDRAASSGKPWQQLLCAWHWHIIYYTKYSTVTHALSLLQDEPAASNYPHRIRRDVDVVRLLCQ